MGATRRYSRRIKRAGQRAENQHLRAQVAALTEALEVQEAAPVFTDELSPEAAWEAAGFTPVVDGPGPDITPADLWLEDEIVSAEQIDTELAGDLSPAAAAFRRVTGAD